MTGWAILGTGAVSARFVTGLTPLGEAAKLIAIASRDPENARRFAARHGGQAVASYAEAVVMPGVDAVYVASPPAQHEAHAMLAIEAGKAVLIEKPFAPDAASAARIIAAARARGIFCMEAMWTRFMPMVVEVQKRLDAGTLGEIRAFSAAFMGSDLPDPKASLFDPVRGGGALAHRAIYPLSLARLWLGPAEIASATARIGETGVDEDCTIVLRHGTGALSTLTASLRAPGPNRALISGSHGMIELDTPVWRPFRGRQFVVKPRRGGTGGGRPIGGGLSGLRDSGLAQGLQQRLPRGLIRALGLGGGKTLFFPYVGNGYHYEASEVARCLAAGQLESPRMSLDETLDILRLADAARALFATTETPK